MGLLIGPYTIKAIVQLVIDVRQKDKQSAIEFLHKILPIGLKEAKELVEAEYERRWPIADPVDKVISTYWTE